jgi:hypothetical protein
VTQQRPDEHAQEQPEDGGAHNEPHEGDRRAAEQPADLDDAGVRDDQGDQEDQDNNRRYDVEVQQGPVRATSKTLSACLGNDRGNGGGGDRFDDRFTR